MTVRATRLNKSNENFPPCKPDLNFKKIAGAALAAVGTILALYGAGLGASKLIGVFFNNFGLVLVSSLLNL